jgi:hypothetical protein
MGDKKKEDKPERKPEPPPRRNDPKLSQVVDFTEKPTQDTIIFEERKDR